MTKKVNGKNRGDYRFMIGVLDAHSHENLFYGKNLKLRDFETIFAEIKKKYK